MPKPRTFKHRAPPKRERSCHGKRRYKDQEQAKSALRVIAQRSERTQIATRAYFCPDCNGWHVTSQAKLPGTPDDLV